MAEGFTRALKGDLLEPFSAGIESHGINPSAVRVMAEVGIDISGYRSKIVDEFVDTEFEFVVTVCSAAAESCPVFPAGIRLVHHGFDDPPSLAENMDSEEERLECYRRVRDERKAYVLSLPDALDTDDQLQR